MNESSQRPKVAKVSAALGIAAVALSVSACGNASSDVSSDGQIDYACALIADVKENRNGPEDWGNAIGNETDPAIIQAVGAAALVGAATGGGAEVSESMLEAGTSIFGGQTRADQELLQQGVDQLAAECDAR